MRPNDLTPWDDDGNLNVVVDTPEGQRNKFKFDEKLGLFRLSKVLPVGSIFPYNFGYVPGTKAEDGDAIDVLVLMDAPVFTGCLVKVRLIGVLEAEQREKGKMIRNDRLIGVAADGRDYANVRHLDDVGEERVAEMEHFFKSYNEMEGREFRVLHRGGPKKARRLVEDARHAEQPRHATN